MGYSRKKIIDLTADLPVSRQRKYQLRRAAEMACIICGQAPVVDAGRCKRHNITLALANLRHRGEPNIPRRGKWLVAAGLR